MQTHHTTTRSAYVSAWGAIVALAMLGCIAAPEGEDGGDNNDDVGTGSTAQTTWNATWTGDRTGSASGSYVQASYLDQDGGLLSIDVYPDRSASKSFNITHTEIARGETGTFTDGFAISRFDATDDEVCSQMSGAQLVLDRFEANRLAGSSTSTITCFDTLGNTIGTYTVTVEFDMEREVSGY